MAPYDSRRWYPSYDRHSHYRYRPAGYRHQGGRDIHGRLNRLEDALRLVESVRSDCACSNADRETSRDTLDASTQVEATPTFSESSSVQQETMNYLIVIRKQVNQLTNAIADLKGELRQRTRHLKKEVRALERSDSDTPEVPPRPYRCYRCDGLGHKARECLTLKIVKVPVKAEDTEQPEKSDAQSQ